MPECVNADGVVFSDVDSDTDVFKELIHTYKITVKSKETPYKLTCRVLKLTEIGTDDQWTNLSDETKDWVNNVQEAKDKAEADAKDGPEDDREETSHNFPWLIPNEKVKAKAKAKETESEDSEDEQEKVVDTEQEDDEVVEQKTKRKPVAAKKPVKESKKPVKAAASKKTNGANGGSRAGRGEKLAMIRKLLTRSGGCTTKDVLEVTGWPAVSMPAMAKAAGLKLNKSKDRPTRYSAKD